MPADPEHSQPSDDALRDSESALRQASDEQDVEPATGLAGCAVAFFAMTLQLAALLFFLMVAPTGWVLGLLGFGTCAFCFLLAIIGYLVSAPKTMTYAQAAGMWLASATVAIGVILAVVIVRRLVG